MQVVPLAPTGENVQDELQAHSDVMQDLVTMCDEAEEIADGDAEAMSFALLSAVHPEGSADLAALCE